MRYPYTGYHGCQSVCDLELIVAPDAAAFVLCTEIPDNPGTSVTNMADQLATKVCRENRAINPTRLTWVEHYPEREHRLSRVPPVWAQVRFTDYNANTGTFRRPDWNFITEDAFNDLRTAFLNSLLNQMGLQLPKGTR